MPLYLLIPAAAILLIMLFGIVLHRNAPTSCDAVSPPAPLPPPPEHSCLVKGVLKSMAEEPEKWQMMPLSGLEDTWIRHTAARANVRLWTIYVMDEYPSPPKDTQRCTVEGVDVTESEAKAIKAAWEGICAVRIAAERAPKLAHFERLGCPDSQGVTS